VIFTHGPVRSKATSVSGKITITEAELQAISDAIAMCSEKAPKNSEIWVYTDSQMALQRLNAKSNVNAKLFDDIRQNLTNLRQNQCQIRIQWIPSRKGIIGNEKADQLAKSAAQELPVTGNTEATTISFVKKQICRGGITMVKCLEKQHQEGKPVSKAHIGRESKSETTKRA